MPVAHARYYGSSVVCCALVLAVVSAAMVRSTSDSDRGVTGVVVGLDIGAATMKVAALKYNSTIDIVLNEQSRRKTPTVVGFRKRSRYVGDDALALAPRFPSLMVPAPNRVAGLEASLAKETLQNSVPNGGLAAAVSDPERGTATFEFRLPTDADSSTSLHAPVGAAETTGGTVAPEELSAMLVDYAASITAVDVGEPAAGAVLAIPHATPLRQRIALREAASMVKGPHFIGFTHSLTAAAVQYGVARGGFGNATAYVVIVDVGASQSQAGLFRFEPAGPRPAAQDSLGTVTTVEVASLPTEGSNAIDACLAGMFDEALVTAHGPESSILAPAPSDASAEYLHKLSQRRFALLRAANGAKEGLSVNSAVQYTVEGATADGADFQGSVTRAEMDEVCAADISKRIAGIASRVASARVNDWAAVTAAAAAAKAAAARTNDSDESQELPAREPEEPLLLLEVTGAGSRVARIATALDDSVDAAGGVGRRLNTDDTVALGATIIATRATAYIRTRGFAVRDIVPCADQLRISVDDPTRAPGAPETAVTTKARRGLFSGCESLPCTRSVSVRVASGQSSQGAAVNDHVSFTVSHPAGFCYGGAAAVEVRNGLAEERQSITVAGIEEAVAQALNHTSLVAADLNVSCRVEFTLTSDGLVEASAASVRVSKPKKEAPTKVASDEEPVEEEKAAAEDSGSEETEAVPKKSKTAKKSKKVSKKAAKKKKDDSEKRHTYADLEAANAPAGATMTQSTGAFFFADVPRPMSMDARTAASSSLAQLAEAENAARAAALQKNDLETLLLMERDDARHRANTAAVALFKELTAWLETGRGGEEGCPATEFEAKKVELQVALAASPEEAADL